ncbi:MAG: hydrogenase maturation protease [Ignavibacteria bacterium]|nr:hydrogenase maturation protease [Ignavibacteria bacterium]
MKTLVLGMGNTLLNDDAVGIITVRHLHTFFKNTPGIDFCETSWGGFKIIDLMRGYEYVIIIDSIKTGKYPAGHIHHLKTSDLLHTLRLNSYHDINFITALKLADLLNDKIPQHIDIIAVEIEDNLTITENLSEEIKGSICNCSERVVDLLINKNLIGIDIARGKIIETLTEEKLRHYYDEEIVLES